MSGQVGAACAACYPAHEGDCSGFAVAVGARLGITLQGPADAIVQTMRADPSWTALADGPAAAQAADAGKFVLAGMKGSEQAKPDLHGHVVVVVGAPLARGAYPTAWWGSLGGQPGKAQTLNWAWTEQDRDRLTYASHEIPARS